MSCAQFELRKMGELSVKWHFIRHGEIDSNQKKIYSGRSEEVLTATGRRQVRSACRELSNYDIDAIYCSPLIRTRQTADLIIDELNWKIPIHIDECFNELKMGPWEGMAESEVEKQFPEEWAIWNNSPANLSIEGRETLQELQSRVTKGMRNIEQNSDYNSVLVVTHVAIIRAVTLFAREIDLNRYKSINVGNAKTFKMELDFGRQGQV